MRLTKDLIGKKVYRTTRSRICSDGSYTGKKNARKLTDVGNENFYVKSCTGDSKPWPVARYIFDDNDWQVLEEKPDCKTCPHKPKPVKRWKIDIKWDEVVDAESAKMAFVLSSSQGEEYTEHMQSFTKNHDQVLVKDIPDSWKVEVKAIKKGFDIYWPFTTVFV